MQKSITAIVTSVAKKMKKFPKDQAGNVGILLGLSIIPLILAAGSAIDYSRIANAKSNLVSALDSSALYAASLTGKTEAEMTTLAQNYFNQNYTNTSDAPAGEITLHNYADKVTVSGTVDVKTWFMSVASITHIEVPSQSEVMKSGSSIEVSLVLDQTGSMGGQKLTDLKAAAKSFIDTVIWTDQNPYYAKAALVPFTFAVNPGTYATQARGTYLAGTNATPGYANLSFKDSGGTNRTFPITNCVSERLGADATTDASPSGAPVGRVYDNAQTDCNNIPAIIPLTNDKTVLKTAIDNMVAGGSTAGQIGMAWGYYMVSPTFGLWSGASAPGSYTQDHLKKIVVFMTDGDFNTAYCKGVPSSNYSGGNTAINCNATLGDPTAQAQQICSSIKARDITLYTIGFQLPNNTAKTFMANCATDSSKSFDAADSAQLQAAFAAIAQNLLELRVSR
jgi:Flp pilus assembly protein TadG